MNRRDAEAPREDGMTGEIKLYHRQIGLLLNFNVPVLKDGIKRIVNNYHPSSASRRLAFPAMKIHFTRRRILD